MLQNIRDSAQGWLAWVIVIIICVPFALWGIQEFAHTSAKRVIAEVNDAELSEMDFKQRVSQQKRQLQSMLQDQSVDLSFMNQQIRQSVLKQMIEEEVLVQSATNANMRIGNDLLSNRIHSIPAFQQDGKFSQQRYEQVIRNQYSSPAAFEIEIRRSMLTEQIRNGILRSALFTDYDHKQQTRLKDQERSIIYLIIAAKRFEDTVEITDADITAYYKKYANQYMTPAQVSVEYVELSQSSLITEQGVDEESLKERYKERKISFTKPGQWQARHILLKVAKDATPDEVKVVETKAKDLIIKINAGESFAELAKQSSDDPGSKDNGGDLGWFGKDRMVKPFEDAVKALKVGEVSVPVKTQYGFHIIKLEASQPATTRSFAEVRDQLKLDVQKERAESEFYEQAEQFANLAFEHPDSLEILTDTLSLHTKTSELFDRTGGDPKNVVLSNRKFIKAAFSDTVLKEGFNSDVVEVGEHHIAVLRLRDHKAAQPKPQANVKDVIVAAIKSERTKAEAKTLGQDLIEQIKQNGNPEIVKTKDLAWSPVHWVTRKDTALNQAIISQVFKMGQPTAKDRALYQGIELGNGDYALVAMLGVKDGVVSSETSAKDDVEKARQAQQQAYGESEFGQFISELKVGAEIKDYSTKLVERDL